MARVICRKSKGMTSVPAPPRAKNRGGRGDNIKQQLQAKVSGSLASRGVSISPTKLWERRPSKEMTPEEKRRLEKQRENKRRWARKEREKSRQLLEHLRTTNGSLEFKNQKLKKEVEMLRRRQFSMQTALLKHEGICQSQLHSISPSEIAKLQLGRPLQIVGGSNLPSTRTVLVYLASDGEEEGPMQKLHGRSVQIRQGKVHPGRKSDPKHHKQKSRSDPKARFTPEAVPLVTYLREKGKKPNAGKRVSSETVEESPVLMSGGFTPRIDEVGGQKSYMEMLREDEDDDAMVVEEISEIPLLTAPEIKQEPSDVEDAMFLQEVESCTPQLEELVQKNQKHAKENGDGAEETEAEVSGTAQFFELGSGKLGLASGPFVLKASDATVPKARARGAGPVVNGIGRSYTMSLPTTKSVTFVSPWSVAAETPAVSLSRGEEETNPTYVEIIGPEQHGSVTTIGPEQHGSVTTIGPEQHGSVTTIGPEQHGSVTTIGPEQHGSVTTTTNSENFKTPPINFTRRRAVSESAVSYSSRSAPDRMTTISDDWAEMLRSVPVPQRAHSLPAGYIPEIDQVIEVDADTTGHATLDGDVIEVVEVLNETEGVEGRWEVEETADQLSIDTPGQPDILVTQAEIPSTPSTPSTPTSTVSSKAIFVNSSITLEDPEDAARVELPMDDVITISGVIVQ